MTQSSLAYQNRMAHQNPKAHQNGMSHDATIKPIHSIHSNAEVARQGAHRYSRIGWLLVLIGFVGFVLWAGLAPLDRGIVVEGTVTVAGYRKAVQHPSGGVVDRILVSEGEQVQQGQVLVELDDAVYQAQAMSAQSHYVMALAARQRLIAEREGLSRIPWEALPQQITDSLTDVPNLDLASLDFTIMDDIQALQQRLFHSRRQSLNTELLGLAENLASGEARLKGLQGMQTSQQQRYALLTQRIDGLKALAEQDYIPRNRVLELQGMQAQLLGEQLSTDADIGSIRRQQAEIQARSANRKANYQQEVNRQLADIRLEIETQKERLTDAYKRLAQSQMVAPVSGRVVDLKIFTEGGVISPAELLMEILPDNQPLLVDARLPLEAVDSLYEGQAVDLMFTAFNRSQTPKVAGQVVQISADRLKDAQTQQLYYGLRIEVSADAMNELQGLTVLPGMPVQAFVRNGERSLLSYLFKPFTDRLPMALAEDQ